MGLLSTYSDTFSNTLRSLVQFTFGESNDSEDTEVSVSAGGSSDSASGCPEAPSESLQEASDLDDSKAAELPPISSEPSSSAASESGEIVHKHFRLKRLSLEEILCVDFIVEIGEDDVKEIMAKMKECLYFVKKAPEDLILAKCKVLFERDYECVVVDNTEGCLNENYPVKLIIPVKTKTSYKPRSEVEFNVEKFVKVAQMNSRCRGRFVVPVMLLANKFICRSATLSVLKEVVYQQTEGLRSPRPVSTSYFSSAVKFCREACTTTKNICDIFWNNLYEGYMAKLRRLDIEMLKDLKLQYICDLMVEDRKTVLVSVSSSEKIHKDDYKDFDIEQIPYPGCEFFEFYKENKRIADGLIFDWNKASAKLQLTENISSYLETISWNKYEEWDIIQLTRNYMKIILACMLKGGGCLVHCISGWDRTPLFISLLRMSLWADGVIHQSLSIDDMIYFTLAYDWFLFGHDFPARLDLGQEIMHFCFNFLPYIGSDEYSLTKMWHEMSPDLRQGDFPPYNKGERQAVLDEVSSKVLQLYESTILSRV